jgi:hypothetical protein
MVLRLSSPISGSESAAGDTDTAILTAVAASTVVSTEVEVLRCAVETAGITAGNPAQL